MADPGLYSILLKWGLDSVTKFVGEKHKGDVSVLLEAIKARNSLVLKRFEYSWEASKKLADLLDDVEDAIKEARESLNDESVAELTAEQNLKNFMSILQSEHHPKLHRSLRKIRGSFEATNDIFSAYSIEFSDFLQFNNFKSLIEETGIKKQADAIRLYRQSWIIYSDIMHTLIRVTSSDLRFWLTDKSYFIEAEAMALQDRNKIEGHLKSQNQESWRLFVEDSNSVEEFWNVIESETSHS